MHQCAECRQGVGVPTEQGLPPFCRYRVEPTPIVNRVLGHTIPSTEGAWQSRMTLVANRLLARV